MRAFVLGICLGAVAALAAVAPARAQEENTSGAVEPQLPDGGVVTRVTTEGGIVDAGPPLAPVVPPPAPEPRAVRLTEVHIEGDLLDPERRLASFLSLEPGAPYGQKEAIELDDQVRRLGYRLDAEPRLDGTVLTIKLVPEPVVRSIRVRGNFPLFDDEILRHVTFTSGTALPEEPLLESFLSDEAKRVSEFLGREGYFGNSVHIEHRVHRQYQVDLIVRVNLGGWSRPYKLEAVRPQGNHAITTHELFDVFSHGWSIWGRFSLARMREDAHRAEQVLKDKGYPAARVLPEFDVQRDADPERRRIILPVKVAEKRRVEIHFVGNRYASEHELREQLTIFRTGAYDEIELAETGKALERFYQQRGYFEAHVSFRRRRIDGPSIAGQTGKREGTTDVEEITFLVDEGPELRVHQVELVAEAGALLTQSPVEVLTKAGVETRVFPRLGVIGLGSGGYISTVQLRQDEERIVSYYKALGFPQTKVHTEVTRDPSAFDSLGALGAASAGAGPTQNELYVRFYVSEGSRELCEAVQITFAGEHLETEADVRKLMTLGPGVPFTEQVLVGDARRIVAAYKSLARPYVQADYAGSTWSADHTRLTARFLVTEGEAVRFGEIIVRGNFTTFTHVVLADLPFRAGEPFDLNKLEQGERNLQSHFIFTSVRLTPVGLASQRTTVPILVTVRERYIDYGSFLVSAGVSSDRLPYYAYVSASYVWSNFFGFGSQIEVRGDFGFSTDAWGVLGRYSDPRVFGPNWRFDATGYWRSEVTNRLGVIKVYGASLQLTRFLSTALRVYLRYDDYKSENAISLSRLPGQNDRQSVTDDTHTAKINVGLVWDRRVGQDGLPSPLAPYRGWLLQGLVGWAFPSSARGNGFVDFFSSDNNFLVLAAQALVIQPFKIRMSTFSFLANLRYDEGIPFSSPALPSVERYFAGGDTATRGYDNDELKTEIIRSGVSPLGSASGFRVVPQGGNVRLLSTVELQFPIAKTFIGLPLSWVGAVFYDAGAVFNAWNVLGKQDVKHSIGVSFLRLLTPIGAISVEYAYPLVQGLAEERWKTNPWYSHFPGRVHFNWGIPTARF